MKSFIENFLHFLPLIFGLGFVAPLTAEILRSVDIALFVLPPLAAGLLLGAVWGGFASWQPRWV